MSAQELGCFLEDSTHPTLQTLQVHTVVALGLPLENCPLVNGEQDRQAPVLSNCASSLFTLHLSWN